MRKYLAAAILIVIAFTAACSGGDDEDGATTTTTSATTTTGGTDDGGATGDVANGKELYAGTCASCHGADAKGIQGLGKPLANSAFVKDTSEADLVAFVEKGRPADDPKNTTGVAMPPKGGNASLTETDVTDIVAYLKTLQG